MHAGKISGSRHLIVAFDIGLVDFKRHGKAEGAAAAQLAFHLDLPAHHVNQAVADGKPQARALLACAGGIDLLELAENARKVLLADADALVCYGKVQACEIFARRIAGLLVHGKLDFGSLA